MWFDIILKAFKPPFKPNPSGEIHIPNYGENFNDATDEQVVEKLEQLLEFNKMGNITNDMKDEVEELYNNLLNRIINYTRGGHRGKEQYQEAQGIKVELNKKANTTKNEQLLEQAKRFATLVGATSDEVDQYMKGSYFYQGYEGHPSGRAPKDRQPATTLKPPEPVPATGQQGKVLGHKEGEVPRGIPEGTPTSAVKVKPWNYERDIQPPDVRQRREQEEARTAQTEHESQQQMETLQTAEVEAEKKRKEQEKLDALADQYGTVGDILRKPQQGPKQEGTSGSKWVSQVSTPKGRFRPGQEYFSRNKPRQAFVDMAKMFKSEERPYADIPTEELYDKLHKLRGGNIKREGVSAGVSSDDMKQYNLIRKELEIRMRDES